MSAAKQFRRQALKRKLKAADVANRQAARARAVEREAEARRRAENPPSPEQRRAMIRMGRTMMAACLGAAMR